MITYTGKGEILSLDLIRGLILLLLSPLVLSYGSLPRVVRITIVLLFISLLPSLFLPLLLRGPLVLYISSLLIFAIHLLIMQVVT